MELSKFQAFGNPLDAIDRMGAYFAKSGMFGCNRVEQGQVLATICIMENKSPTYLLRTFDMLDGKLTKKSLAAAAEYRRAGGKYTWLDTGEDGIEAVGEFVHEGRTLVVRYTMEAAKRQGLVRPNSNWTKTPGNMLRARCVSNAIGMLCPEIYAGEDSESDSESTPAPAMDLGIVGESFCPKQDEPRLNVWPPPQQKATPEYDPAKEPDPIPTKKAVAPVIVPQIEPVSPNSEDEQKEAAMGLAPVRPSRGPATRPPVASIEPEPILPPQPVEPQMDLPVPRPPKPIPPKATKLYPPETHPLIPPHQLKPEDVEAIGQIIEGNFLAVANWMIKEQWLPKNTTPITSEATAGAYLQKNLYLLATSRAKRILTKKMAFMRAVEEIQP